MPRVLIVDDCPALREVVAMMLRDEGYEVSEAANGAEGLARALADRPDVVLCDYMMGPMNGAEFVRQLRATAQAPPVIGFSGDAGAPTAFRLAGAAAVLPKPSHMDEILATVARFARP